MVVKTKKSPLPVRALFRRLLPENFLQKRALIQHYQQFFESQASDAVFQMVTVVNVTEQYLHVSLPNPTLASYFRLHGEQVKQLIRDQFGVELQIKISVRPEVESEAGLSSLSTLPHFSASVCEQINNSADAVEDDELKQALKSLSRTLRHKD